MDKQYLPVDLPPVSGKTFDQMTSKEAMAFFEWHMKFIDARIQNMCTELGFERTSDPKSLIDLWSLIIEEYNLIYKSKNIFAKLINKRRENRFQTIISCAGLYLAEIFRLNHASIYWSCLLDGPESLMDKNMPVLKGFVDDSFTPPFEMYFEPQHMIGVQLGILSDDQRASKEQLYNLYNLWCKFIPTNEQSESDTSGDYV